MSSLTDLIHQNQTTSGYRGLIVSIQQGITSVVFTTCLSEYSYREGLDVVNNPKIDNNKTSQHIFRPRADSIGYCMH